ncbi:hypothetical protein FSP39_017456 [Pinctada imbricata]|uniref:Uncharacterized protein n=1 Tax=Pinctada imbricata TaxID=66713 RepID=A0AA88YHP7_PINIB|nr:hypothetical protein FSP39_017456 [Pinctada imbricata]
MYARNNGGPRTVPCCTPEVTGAVDEEWPSINMRCVCPDKKLWIQFSRLPRMPKWCSLLCNNPLGCAPNVKEGSRMIRYDACYEKKDDSEDDYLEDDRLVFKDYSGSDDDDDDIPESVSFRDSRNDAINRIKTALKEIGAQKGRVKEKRRKLDQQYKEQKKRKLEDLEKEKLSEEFLEDLPDFDTREKSQHDGREATNHSVSRGKKDTVDSLEERLSFEDDEESFADTEDDFDDSGPADFIPLDQDRLQGGVEAETLKKNKKKTLSSLEKAREFKQQALYGSRIKRETSGFT